MEYCIMRIEKRRRDAVYGLQIEANRTQTDHIQKGRDFARSDICWDLTPFNMHLVCSDSWKNAITAAIQDAGAQERKNSVVLLDGFYGASKGWFEGKSLEEIVDYFRACLNFHERTYGKVLNAVIHFDEAVPHLAVASVPLVTDENGTRLSAREIMGNRADYRRRQDQFYEEVGKPRGMARGESHDPENTRKNLSVQEFKKQQLEIQLQELEQQSQALQKDCRKLQFTNQKLEELNNSLAEELEQPFLQHCMMEFIRNAKVKGERGEVKNIYDGFNAYMERHMERLRAEWLQQLPPELAQAAEREHEREWEPEYESREL